MNVIRSKDLWSGVLFAAFGVAALILGAGLRAGTAARMGPGFVPRLLGWALIALGVAIAVRAFLKKSDGIRPFSLRPVVLVPLAIVAFGVLLQPAGLAPAIGATIVIGAAAGRGMRPVETMAAALVLVILCVGVFKVGLGMNVAALQGLW
jgi:hypothetical protein